MALRVYNTLTRRKEEFIPLKEGEVGIYVCGPTVYDHAHIGHAKSYVSFDVVVRYLHYLGYKVRYVQNITDVGHLLDTGEDRILKGAQRERIEPMELVEIYTRSYFEDMDALNVQRPNFSPRASGHIPEQIELVKALIEKGYAYEVNGSVYFEMAKFPGYGRLSGQRVEELEEGARVEVNPDKRDPADFALWKRAEPEHILRWPSPWGWGYPGWHIECSAMSMKYLGQTFDIHGGGVENQFPHHECEIAQSEAATDQTFARYWLHNNMVTVNGAKMSKSLGNFITLKDAFKRYSPMAVRLFILSSHYRSPLDFSDEALSAAAQGLDRLRNALTNIGLAVGNGVGDVDIDEGALSDQERELFIATEEAEAKFQEAMDDDFNTALALGRVFDLARLGNAASQLEPNDVRHTLLGGAKERIERIAGVLGLELGEQRGLGSVDSDRLIDLLVDLRTELRSRKEWALADRIRDDLGRLGVLLEDRLGRTVWRRRVT